MEKSPTPLSKLLWTVGMMSGTSLDGIDVAAIKTDGEEIYAFSAGITVPYAPSLSQKVSSILGQTWASPDILKIEEELTRAHAEAYFLFLKHTGIPAQEVGLVGFHGHTILHQPPSRFAQARTWQIGDAALLSELIGKDIIYNLRLNDVEQGGEGAPLVPVFHQALTKDMDKPLALVNIGGVANVTWLGPSGEILAFDTGPGNGLLNDWIKLRLNLPFDPHGEISAKGNPRPDLVQNFMKNPYFSKSFPKSLDLRDFTLSVLGDTSCLSTEDGAATLLEMTAQSIVDSQKFFPQPVGEWLLTGGGWHNQTLRKRLAELLKPIPVNGMEAYGFHGDFIEAQAFAFLAIRSLRGLPITFPETTGAPAPLTGGVLCKKPLCP